MRSRVSVVGGFNAWDGRRHPMRLRHDAGVWEIFMCLMSAQGDLYKFELLDRDGGDLLPLKADPYARYAQLRPGQRRASSLRRCAAPKHIPAERVAMRMRAEAPIVDL